MPNVVWVDLDKLDLKEGASVQIFNLASDLNASGEVSARFKPVEPLQFQQAGTAVTWQPSTTR